MPDKEEIQLPQCIKKQHLFHDYQKECKRNGRPAICSSSFYAIWRKHFKHVKTPKVSAQGGAQGSLQCISHSLRPT